MSEEHYFSAHPTVESMPQPVEVRLPDLTLDLMSDRGVFAIGDVDRGTDLLLRTIPQPPAEGALIDVGCGYGVIAVVLARRSPGAVVWAIDVNERALELTRRNAVAAGATNVRVGTPDEVPDDLRFAGVYSNPPIRVGKAALHEIVTHWLDRLEPTGSAHLVVHRHLGADSLTTWLVEQGYATARARSRQGYRVLQVQPRAEQLPQAGPGVPD